MEFVNNNNLIEAGDLSRLQGQLSTDDDYGLIDKDGLHNQALLETISNLESIVPPSFQEKPEVNSEGLNPAQSLVISDELSLAETHIGILSTEANDDRLTGLLINTTVVGTLPSPDADLLYESGVFVVDDSGQVSIDFLFDGGKFNSELAIFSLEDMDDLVPDSEAFIETAIQRALSNSEEGYVVISDRDEGARFGGLLREHEPFDWNSGEHLGVKTFDMNPGDRFGFMFVPKGGIQRLENNPSLIEKKPPMFSMIPSDSSQEGGGQFADLTGGGHTFAIEDIALDNKSDQDYNDFIFQIQGAEDNVTSIGNLISPTKDWRDTQLAADIIKYAQLSDLNVSVSTPSILINSGGYLTDVSDELPVNIALDFVQKNYTKLGLEQNDLSDLKVTDEYQTSINGAHHVYFQQYLDGLAIFNASLNFTIASDGQILTVGNRFIANLEQRRFGTNEPQISKIDAIKSAADSMNVSYQSEPELLTSSNDISRESLFLGNDISQDNIPVKLMYDSTEDGELKLVWHVVINSATSNDWREITVDAENGEILRSISWEAHADYHVYSHPAGNPEDSGRTLEISPEDPIASPFGWHDIDGLTGAEFNDTRGNNVFAQEDRDADNSDGFRPAGTSTLTFDFPVDLTQSPEQYEAASITNLFYWNNILHDIHYHYGFDEAAGNFQQNNYGNGGLEGDPVQADAQDGSGLNNANFFTPPDGQMPRMQMFQWDNTTPYRDSSFDNEIIIHEYGHGISNRLTGGPANSAALSDRQSRGMGEGWSDFWAIALTTKATDTSAGSYGLGTYVLGQDPDIGGGIRQFPYSTDMSVNPLTYGDITDMTSGPHPRGTIWATTLLDLFWNLVDQYGFDEDMSTGTGGNNIALQLVMDGLKIQPANPSFLDARDAILAADQLNNDSRNQDLIWQTFARRGMGFSALDGGNADSLDVTEAFDLPPNINVVDVTVPGSQASENGDSGSFVVTRSGDTSVPLDVAYTVSGSAENGVDYELLSGIATILPGTTSVVVAVNPIDDEIAEGNELVTLTLATGAGYQLGTDVNGTVTITDNDLPDLSGSYFNVINEPLDTGELFTTEFAITNSQAGQSGPFEVDFYLSDNNTISTFDRYLGSYTVANVGGNSSTGTLTRSLRLPAREDTFWDGNTNGTEFYIGMIVDADNDVTETNENNNDNNGWLTDYDDVAINSIIFNAWSSSGSFDSFTQQISDRWDQDRELIAVEYGDGRWFGIFGEDSRPNAWSSSGNFDEFQQQIRDRWDQDLNLIDVEYGDGRWFGVFSRDIGRNSWSSSGNFDQFQQQIRDRWNQDYELVDVAYGDGRWFGVFSDDARPNAWSSSGNFDEFEQQISDRWDQDFDLIDVEYGDGRWFGIFGPDDGRNSWSSSGDFDEFQEQISDRWDEGFELVDIAYGDGRWFGVFQD